MTKKQRNEHKRGNAVRRDYILTVSKGKPKGENLLIYLGGVCQKSKYSKV